MWVAVKVARGDKIEQGHKNKFVQRHFCIKG